jgi:hypothetical protein
MMNSRKIKWIGIIITSCLSAAAFATGAGFYIGGQAGLSNTHNPTQTVYVTPNVTVSPSNTGPGMRLFAGYGFNQYAAFEGGFTQYYSSKYSVSGNNPTIQENGIDMVAKGMYPIYSVAVFGKAGIAFIRQSISGALNPNPGGKASSSIFVYPTVALGVSYDFSQNWVGDLSFSRVLKIKSGSLQNADFISFGISYHFVDVYCGQFLC